MHNIKPRHTIIVIILLISVTLFTCSKSDADTVSCDFSTESYTTNNDGTVTYTVTKEGNGSTISSITYRGTDGVITVPNPGDNFTLSAPVKKGTVITLNVKGTAVEGQLRAQYKFISTTGTEQGNAFRACPGD
ncbi:hypothetical protein [Solitalea lacus]|uniref:hypothetical protein n=1 Tax=Solitalea lacus TaxID=2911172 RepID=UPI001EDA6405|nr:hypothetical protein [Solitalea lacus]UKJ05782.1 hypothetical protein L2B55_09490 [Solitalea lacus]